MSAPRALEPKEPQTLVYLQSNLAISDALQDHDLQFACLPLTCCCGLLCHTAHEPLVSSQEQAEPLSSSAPAVEPDEEDLGDDDIDAAELEGEEGGELDDDWGLDGEDEGGDSAV